MKLRFRHDPVTGEPQDNPPFVESPSGGGPFRVVASGPGDPPGPVYPRVVAVSPDGQTRIVRTTADSFVFEKYRRTPLLDAMGVETVAESWVGDVVIHRKDPDRGLGGLYTVMGVSEAQVFRHLEALYP